MPAVAARAAGDRERVFSCLSECQAVFSVLVLVGYTERGSLEEGFHRGFL